MLCIELCGVNSSATVSHDGGLPDKAISRHQATAFGFAVRVGSRGAPRLPEWIGTLASSGAFVVARVNARVGAGGLRRGALSPLAPVEEKQEQRLHHDDDDHRDGEDFRTGRPRAR